MTVAARGGKNGMDSAILKRFGGFSCIFEGAVFIKFSTFF